jgi:peptidyl-prolyl cis-trans isomerase C
MKVALLLVALAGCRHAAESSGGAWQVPLSAPSEDAVVATVDGRPIRSSEIATQARAAGTSAKQALADLVDAELLAGEAAKRGLTQDHDVQLAVRQAAAHRLLETTFEKEVTPAALSERDYRRGFNAQRNMFDHSEYVDTWHILVPADAKAPPDEKQAARAIAEQIAKRARGVESADAFRALATEIAPPPGKTLKLEQIITARDGWVVPEYSIPAFDQLKKPGDTSTVVETNYGYHVIYLNKRIPARHASLEEAKPELAQYLFPPFQRAEFSRFVGEAMLKHHVEEHSERVK